MDAGEAGWIEQTVGIKQNEQVVAGSGESLDRPLPVGNDRVWGRVDLVHGNANHLRHGVDHAAHRAVSDVDDDRAGVGV